MFRAVVALGAKSVKKTVVLPSKSFATYKTTTGLVGLAVDPNGRETLAKLAADVLSSVQKIPAESDYRVDVEKWFNYIAKVTKDTADIKAIEDAIDLGQIEEVIEMAKDELSLIDYYYEHKGWELVAQAERDADKLVEAMADSIYFTNPEARAQPAQVAAPPK